MYMVWPWQRSVQSKTVNPKPRSGIAQDDICPRIISFSPQLRNLRLVDLLCLPTACDGVEQAAGQVHASIVLIAEHVSDVLAGHESAQRALERVGGGQPSRLRRPVWHE